MLDMTGFMTSHGRQQEVFSWLKRVLIIVLDIPFLKKQLEKNIEREQANGGNRPGQQSNTQSNTAQASEDPNQGLIEEFTEARAAAVEAEFGQLILSCLDTMEGTIDKLIATKIALINERARIQATITALEERIDGFKKRADEIIEPVDPFEMDIVKLQGIPQ